MIKKVVIVGAGVAGLTAAHELIERGFKVAVYERNRRRSAGGKARSVDTDREARWYSGQKKPKGEERLRRKGGLPGEHGFRFFPGWYRHLPDTMSRIPYKSDGRTVLDNLVPAEAALFASYDREPVRALVRFPANWQELRRVTSFPQDVLKLGLTVEDLSFFLSKMWTFLTSSEQRRQAEFETQSWWDFMETDSRSKAFRDYLVVGATRTLVAAKPRQASAYTIGKMVLQTMFDVARPDTYIDRLLNGPTNEVWIDPWVDYLESQGVEFHFEYELQSIQVGNDGQVAQVDMFRPPYAVKRTRERLEAAEALRQRVAALVTLPVPGQPPVPPAQPKSWSDRWRAGQLPDAGRLVREARRTIPAVPDALECARLRDAGLSSLLNVLLTIFDRVGEMDGPVSAPLVPGKQAKRRRKRKPPKDDDARLGHLQRLIPALEALHRRLDVLVSTRRRVHSTALDRRARDEAGEAREPGAPPPPPTQITEVADFYLFAMPVEQMAYYVHRSESLKRLDPGLANLARLSEHVDWMAGIQFYLNEEIGLTRGHIQFLDSEWHLTGLAQSQFWSKEHDLEDYGQGSVRTILSVDISSWDTPGRKHRKPAWDCTPDEIAQEVWEQLKMSLNRPGVPAVLTDAMLCTGERRWYYLDQSIADHFDRRKQGFYEKFRSVGFSSAELVRKSESAGKASEIPEAHGDRLLRNAEPLLVNRPGSWQLRPEASTAIRNMFLAGDYVRTDTNLATMEGANESARRAVNEILAQCREAHRPCKLWSLWEPMGALRAVDQHLFERKIRFQDTGADIPIRLAAGAAKTAVSVAGRAVDLFVRTTAGAGGNRPQSRRGNDD